MCLAVIKERGAPSLRADGVDRGGEDAGPRSQFRVKLTLLTVSWTNYAQELLTSPRTFVWFGGVRWWWRGGEEKKKGKKKKRPPSEATDVGLSWRTLRNEPPNCFLTAFGWNTMQRQFDWHVSCQIIFYALYNPMFKKKNLQISHSWYVTAAVFDLQERNCWQSHDSAQCCLCS